ncbi:MAG: o-succinylbenzoate synthase [bacterium]|nr:o-succinylbenzoate synthase [bacterium]
MAYKVSYEKKTFVFKRPSGTSRGVLTEKHAWFLHVSDTDNPKVKGIGECSIIPGLSPDFESFEQYEAKLDRFCEDPTNEDITAWPSLLFGWESALLDLKSEGRRFYFDNPFSRGETSLPINGLIWMGDEEFMQQQIQEKLASGFTTIKMKIGAIDFETELRLLRSIRGQYSKEEITLRVDANGAFSVQEAPKKLSALHRLGIHSIEQPIKAGQWDAMKELCRSSELPIALDEELIGIHSTRAKELLLDRIRPHYIILKPSLHGGISGTQEWVSLAEERNIAWWMTSALESNIGLEVICQLAGNYDNDLPQGLGTGSLYVENVPSDLVVEEGKIFRRLNDELER